MAWRPCGHDSYQKGCYDCERIREDFLKSSQDASREIWTDAALEFASDMVRIFGRVEAEQMMQEAFRKVRE